MILIINEPADTATLMRLYPVNTTESQILRILLSDEGRHNFSSEERLDFELKLRSEIVRAAEALNRSRLAFRVFRESFCNKEYWDRMPDGGFALKASVKPSEAVRDIYKNSHKYGTECATAMLIVYYKSLLEVFGDEAFDNTFTRIYLMNWYRIEPLLREVGLMGRADVYLPGDRRYFKNPDVDPATPELQGENVIDLGGGFYYGHGFGRHRAEVFIKMLNRNRADDADEEAYLMDTAGNPNYGKLYEAYRRAQTALERTA
jgi:protein-glutamine gamma-glutamyltransferase